MNVKDFISSYKNHPILFIGTGISLRYLSNSYTWDGLLSYISNELKDSEEYYLDLKSKCLENSDYRYDKIAALLEQEFNRCLEIDRSGKFFSINDIFYQKMKEGICLSRFKIYICFLLDKLEFRDEKLDEISELKKIRKNIGSVITTNYDTLIERIFDFEPLIGNNILLSNPYGSVYKIHGSVSDPDKIIINDKDYINFEKKYDLIRAQLLSLFIHNPIIFLGYNVGDNNIKNLLQTIFSYVPLNTELSERVRKNFLLVEYVSGSENEEISEHDISINDSSGLVRINKLRTNNFTALYKSLADLSLPISAMDVRKVQSIVKDIYSGGDIKVQITEDIDSLNNGDRVLAIGSSKTISVNFQTIPEMMSNYFSILEEDNSIILETINKQRVTSSQWFPIFAFSEICAKIEKSEQYKQQQESKLTTAIEDISGTNAENRHIHISDIELDDRISQTSKTNAILWAIMNNNINLEEVELFLRSFLNKSETSYRKMLCAYDYKKYN